MLLYRTKREDSLRWDKTGTVVENKEYDKVLIKLDGSGRLTTRNRRFVKKIVSPPDPVQTGVSQAQQVVHESEDDVIPDRGVDFIPGPPPVVESGIVEKDMSDDQMRHNSQGDEVGDIGIIENEVTDNIITNENPVLNDRPRRDHPIP